MKRLSFMTDRSVGRVLISSEFLSRYFIVRSSDDGNTPSHVESLIIHYDHCIKVAQCSHASRWLENRCEKKGQQNDPSFSLLIRRNDSGVLCQILWERQKNSSHQLMPFGSDVFWVQKRIYLWDTSGPLTPKTRGGKEKKSSTYYNSRIIPKRGKKEKP